jgi:hypothetical protein
MMAFNDVAYVLQDQFWSVLGMLMFFAQFGNIFGGMDICNIPGNIRNMSVVVRPSRSASFMMILHGCHF